MQIDKMNAFGARGFDLFQKGEYEKAIVLFKQILKYDDIHPEALIWIGNCNAELSDFNGAITYYQKAINSLESTSSYEDKGYMLDKPDLLKNAYYQIAMNYSYLGDHASAFSGFQSALKQDPDNKYTLPSNAAIYTSFGVVKAEQGDYDGAILLWDKALAIDPNDEIVLSNKAEALRQKEFHSTQE